MVTAQQLHEQWARLQRVDKQAGRWFGASDHIGDGFLYALAMGAKVFIAGFSVAWLTVALILLFSIIPDFEAFLWLGGMGYGFTLLIVAHWLYPKSGAFVLAFMVDAVGAAAVGLAAGMMHMDVSTTLHVAVPALMNVWLPILVVLLGFDLISRYFAWVSEREDAYYARQPRRTPLFDQLEADGYYTWRVKAELGALTIAFCLWACVAVWISIFAAVQAGTNRLDPARLPLMFGLCLSLCAPFSFLFAFYMKRLVNRATAAGFVREPPPPKLPRLTFRQWIGLDAIPDAPPSP